MKFSFQINKMNETNCKYFLEGQKKNTKPNSLGYELAKKRFRFHNLRIHLRRSSELNLTCSCNK
jgi:hypothetical protein